MFVESARQGLIETSHPTVAASPESVAPRRRHRGHAEAPKVHLLRLCRIRSTPPARVAGGIGLRGSPATGAQFAQNLHTRPLQSAVVKRSEEKRREEKQREEQIAQQQQQR